MTRKTLLLSLALVVLSLGAFFLTGCSAGDLVDAAPAAGMTIAMAAGAPMIRREAFYGSSLTAGLDTDADPDVTSTLTVNDRTQLDLDRIVGFVTADAVATTYAYPGFDLSENVHVSALTVKGSDYRIVGRNTGIGVLPWSPLRGISRLFPLGKYDLATSSTVAVSAGLMGTNIQGSFSFAAPGTTGLEAPNFQPQGPCQVLSAPEPSQVAAGGALSLTVTADKAGFAYLNNAVLGGLLDAMGETEAGLAKDPILSTYLTSIMLPGSVELILGNNTPTVSAGIFHQRRHFNWFNPGWVAMDAGAQIVVTGVNLAPDAANYNLSIPFWPSDDAKKGCS